MKGRKWDRLVFWDTYKIEGENPWEKTPAPHTFFDKFQINLKFSLRSKLRVSGQPA
jgi:hypothetical protein